MKTNLVRGHTLISEGSPRHQPGDAQTWQGYWIGGRGECSCGAMSPILQSTNARKRWHREHKDSVRAEVTA